MLTKIPRVKIILLIFITLLSIYFRLYHLSSLPPSLFADEVDAGYQAFTFNQNRTDYFGHQLPSHFQSFSDWRTPFYIYSIALVNKVIGYSDIAVRLPSVIFGSLIIPVLFLLTGSLIPPIMFAVSPWAIHYGRTGFEVMGMLLVFLLGILFWQRFYQSQKKRFLYLSIVFFCLSPYFYSTAKLFLILIFFILLIVFSPQIKKIGLKTAVYGFLVASLCLLPLIIDTVKGNSGFRFSYINIFTRNRSQSVDLARYHDILLDQSGQVGVKTPFASFFFHNKFQLIAKQFFENYISSFSTTFLVLGGDANPRHGFGGKQGLIYATDLIFVLVGIYLVIRQKSKFGQLFLWLLLLAPIPYALTVDSSSPHSTRLILMLPSIIILASEGVKRFFTNPITKIIIVALLSFQVISFWHYYLYHYPQDTARYWHTGMKEAVLAAQGSSPGRIIFSDTFEPFLPFYLYYSKYQLAPKDSVSSRLRQIDTPLFTGKSLDNHAFFGRIAWSQSFKIPPDLTLVIPKSEYNNLPENYQKQLSIVTHVPAVYVIQEEFLILRPLSGLIITPLPADNLL
ncbi:MAG: hypothetical protein WC686_02185 [Candidatus Shapirobacteria bacterium]|jgi:hypothetical protein